MNTGKMRAIATLIHLTIHKIGFHLKFPATLSLELELDKKNTTLVDGVVLGKETIAINKQLKFETSLNYDDASKNFEDKKATILICIKTKTSDNKLTAGVVPLQLCNPTQHLTNVTAKPLRCNDPKAFIEYSLRTETIRKTNLSPDQTQTTQAGEVQDAKKTIFKSAVHYNNYSLDNTEHEMEEAANHNELDRYLSSAIRTDQRRRHKSSGKLPINSMQNCQEEDSRTEIMAYRKDQLPNECSIASSRHSIEKQARQLSKRSEALSKQVSEARLLQKNLKAENKELKTKVSKYQQEIDQRSSQIISLNKRFQLRENSSNQEMKQLKTKLSEAETQLHQLLLQKNQYLNQRETKEKEAMAALKEKDKQLVEDKRKYAIELQIKNQQIQRLKNHNQQYEESLNHSQKMVTDLIIQMEAKEKECQKLNASLQALKLEILEKESALHGLEAEAADKGKAFNDLKSQKKLIYEVKQERDQKQIALGKSATAIKQLQLAISQKDELIRTKSDLLENAIKENESLKCELKQEAVTQADLISKLKEYELELKRSADNSSKISKQIKDVESELKGIKRQASNSVDQRTQLVSDYESIIASLQEKVAVLTDQQAKNEQTLANLNTHYKQKEDECYDLGQQLIISKEEIATLATQIEIVKEENTYLRKTMQELTEKEERLLRTEEKLEYNERLYEQLEQKLQLQKIEFENEIRMLEQRNDEKTEAMKNLSDQIRKAQREHLQLMDQIETLRIDLTNRTSELNYLKMENDRNRDSTIQFEQRMAALRRIEETASSTVEELREENEGLRRMLQENSEAMTVLGKRYDSLYRATADSLTQLLDLLCSGRSIINLSLKHQKPQISSLLNDCLRQVATERQASNAETTRLTKAFEQESAANRQNVKIIRLKAQMQKELEDEMSLMKAKEEILQSTISKLANDILNHEQTIKQKEIAITDLNNDIAVLKKDFANQIAKKEEAIQKGQQYIDKLNHQKELEAEKYTANIEKVKLAMANMQAELQAKITHLNQALSDSSAQLKSERENSRQQKIKISDLESVNAKIIKQKQDVFLDLEKRTNQLITARLQSENKSKTLAEKDEMISNLQKSVDKLSSEKEFVQNKLQKSQQANKQLAIKKSECDTTIKERNNEIILLKMRIEETEDAKNKLIQQKEELTNNKAVQETLVSTLNQTIKSLKDTSLKSEDLIKKMNFEKECADRDYNKKLNVLTNEKTILEKQFNEFRLKTTQKENELAAKERALAEELKASKMKVGEYSSTIADLRKELESGNAKLSNLSNQFNTKTAEFQSKEKNLLPSAGKLKQVMQSIAELRNIGKEYQASKSKLLRLTNNANLKEQDYERMCDVAREMGIAINKVKIQVLNKLGLTTEVKTTLLQALKNLQTVAEKLNRN